MSGRINAPALRINPADLSYDLPEHFIAQQPASKRDEARLMVVNRFDGRIDHRIFKDLPALLKAGDVLVLNEARVSRAKLVGRKETGGRVEAIYAGPGEAQSTSLFLLRPAVRTGARILFSDRAAAVVLDRNDSGEYVLRWEGEAIASVLERDGRLPLPPYIKRSDGNETVRYQTVYGQTEGSLAAPTAGLHFTPELLKRLEENGIQVEKILLHVGWGTFKPVQGSVESHRMLPERFEIPKEAWRRIVSAKAGGKRLVAVGTTVTRALESQPATAADADLSGQTDLFIKPGFTFRWLDGLLTNFHVPRSTPIALTAAFAGLEPLNRAYAVAIAEHYRFYSYGDAMLIL